MQGSCHTVPWVREARPCMEELDEYRGPHSLSLMQPRGSPLLGRLIRAGMALAHCKGRAIFLEHAKVVPVWLLQGS